MTIESSLHNADIFQNLRDFSLLSICFRFVLATICSSLIGFERGMRSHAAGLRTHIVVCLGAAATMMINQYIILHINPLSDPARIGAQVISGIGFLGAGTIMITGQRIRGLTTAAGLWASACMGLSIGVGAYEVALVLCGFLFIVIVALNHWDARFLKTATSMRLYLEYSETIPFSVILHTLRSSGWHLTNIETLNKNMSSRQGVLLDIRCSVLEHAQEDVSEAIRHVEGVLYVEDL